MKKLLFILLALTLFSIQSFAQDTTYVKVRGIPGAYNFSKNASNDSIIFYVSGVRHALSVGTPVDLTPFVRYVDTPNMLSSYATKQKVKADSTVLANAITSASGGGVTQFNSRTGAIVPQAVDYSSFYYPLSTNPAGYITSVPAQSWTSITGKPTFATVATTGSYNDLSNKPTIPTVPTVVSAFTNDVPYASLSKVQSDSTTLQSSINPAFVNQSFDTSTRALTLTRIDGTSQSVVIPKGTANGTSGIGALSSSRTADVVSVMGDNGTKTTFSVNSSDSATRVHNGDNISVLNNNANYITSSGAPVQSVAGKTGAVALAKSDVGLSNVDNTSDISKPISTATQTALNSKADKATTLSAYGITDAYPLTGNPSGFLTSASITGKINYTDSSSMLSPYLRKVDTTGKWISPAVANATYVHLTGNETITGTKLFNSYFQVNSNSNTYWGNGLNGQLSWDASNIIINAMNGKNLVLQTSFNPALTLDGNGNGTFRGSIHSQQAFDSSEVPILGQIYPSQKKWVIFGDSFSSTDIRYWGTVRDKLKLTGIVTNAVSGNKIYQQSAKLDSILTANPAYFNSFDICSILIGINDFAGSTSLGSYTDGTSATTYAGYLRHMIEAILTANPKIELYIMTPPEANGAGVSYKATNTAGWTVKQMANLIKQISNDYAVQVIDLYNLSQFNSITIPTLTEDGLHPNPEGSKFLGNIVANAFVNRNNAPFLTSVDSLQFSTRALTQKKVDSLGALISGQVAGVSSVNSKTGAVTLTKTDIGLGSVDNTPDLNKPISTATQTALNTKANDNNVIHPTGNETASGKWLNNSFIALGGELSDLGMTGLFDRNELTNADLRGTVTVTQYTSGAASDVTSLAPAMFDGSGNFSSFVETSGSSDSLKVLIDLGANVPNYNAGYWQPFVAFRLPYDLFKNIKVEVSTDNSTWTTSNTPASWSFNSTSQVFFPTGYWMGAKDYCANLASTWRYIRFSFKNPSNTDPYVYISEIGMRHSSAPYARQYLLKAGDNIYGTINLMNKATSMGSINPLTGTFTGIFSGNSTSATKLATPRNINGVPFDGTANITVTDATKEPTITAGTTSQYWRGDKTWQSFSTLPVSTATQTALNAKLDTSYRDTWGAADPFVSDTINKILGIRQSWVDSIRSAGFATKVLGFDVEGDTTVVNAYKNIVIRNFGSLMFQGANNVFQYGWIPFNLDNGGLYSYIEDRNGVVRENIVLTPTGIGVDGLNTPTAKVHFPASSGNAGDAPIKIDGGKLLTIPENGAIERDSASERLFDTHLGIRDKIAYESDLKNYLTKDSIGNRNYANDSLAVANGHLGLYDFYRTGDVVKVVTTLPNFVFTYTVDYTTGANDSAQFFINMLTTNSPINVDWGDGTVENFSSYGTALSPPHKYTSYGTYIVRIGLGVNGGNLVNKFWSNNYPYAAKITSVTNLDQLSNITDIDLGGSLELTNTTVDFAYPSTLIKLGINSCGLTSFVPTHNLPATLNYLNLQNNSLNSAAVDSTLNWLANTQTFNAGAKNLYITQGGSAPPTSASSAAITTLQSEGWTITHD